MLEYKIVEQGIHKSRGWKVLQAVKHPLKQLKNDYFFEWEDDEYHTDPQWIPGIDARSIGIKLGTYPAECAKYFLRD